jgi:hypothetical protein
MNFSTLVGDSEEAVLENYKRFCDAIGVDYKKKYGSFGATNFGGSVCYPDCLYCLF